MNPPLLIILCVAAILSLTAITKKGRARLLFFFLDNADIERARTRKSESALRGDQESA